MSFKRTNLILLLKQTERLLSGLVLVYKMSTPRRYYQLTWRIEEILGALFFYSKNAVAWAGNKRRETNYTTPPGDRVTFNGWKAGSDGPMNRETSLSCGCASLCTSTHKPVLCVCVCVHVLTICGVWFYFYLFLSLQSCHLAGGDTGALILIPLEFWNWLIGYRCCPEYHKRVFFLAKGLMLSLTSTIKFSEKFNMTFIVASCFTRIQKFSVK